MKNLPRKLVFGIAVALFLVIPIKVFAQSSENQDEQLKNIKIGVLAKRGYDEALARWKPLANHLTAASSQRGLVNYKYEIVPLDFSEIYKAVENEEIDFVLANSAIYIELEELYGASRIATMKNLRLGEGYTQFGGVLFTSKKLYPNTTLEDFKGKKFGAVENNSLGGYYAALGEFKKQNVNPESFFSDTFFLGTHDDVVYAVSGGQVDIGTVRTDTLEAMESEGKISIDDFHIVIDYRGDEEKRLHTHSNEGEKFPFIHSTDLYPEWPMARLENTSQDVSQELTHGLLEIEEGSEVAKLTGIDGWIVPEQYSNVRELLKTLKVSPYEDYGEFSLIESIVKFKEWVAAVATLLIVSILSLLFAFANNLRVKSSIRKFEKLLDISRAIILELNLEGEITLINEYGANLLGYTDKNKLIGLSWIEEFIPKEDKKEIKEMLKSISEGGSNIPGDMITSVKSKDGNIHKIRWDNTLIRKRGKVTGIFSYGIDVTKSEKHAESLRKQAEEMERLNKKMIGRELKMKELKQEIDELKEKIKND